MSIAPRLYNYLNQAQVDYDVLAHGFTESAYDSACVSRLPSSNVVKAVLLKDRFGSSNPHYVIAAIPAGNKLKIPWVNQELQRDLVLAEEVELASLFPDCLLGAVPAMAQAYNIQLIWDDQLARQPELYFEGGNHEELIHIHGDQFPPLFDAYPHTVISLPAESYSIYHADEIRSGMD